MNAKTNPACGLCRCFHRGITNTEAAVPINYGSGECRALPPKVATRDDGEMIRGMAVWPVVDELDWCAAFAPVEGA